MKKIKQLIMLMSIVVIASSCSSIKVVDSWKADEIESLAGAKILVIARSDDMVGRQRFEQEIAERLRAGGVDAMESYKKFPAMKQNQELTEEQIAQRVQIIKNEGYKGVVLTVLKDMSKEIVTSETGGYVSGGYYPSYYGGYYGGFGGYYGRVYSPYGYGYGGTYVPSETRTYTSETYNLETVIYNLDLEPGKQLLGVIAIDITDPKSASKVAPKYADAVAKQLKK
ncbi:hypothetical protein LCM02_05685 [Lutimonas saemankumensis]|uniref:hypothetical protein n=1 Tax=Lutimonas saemankumensis TaxID=483016 RepID=UPI001CD5659F|nr:hypothetical protein [Lutimonas saemankumensis]MCA0931934.1 hypothetical protein [Lutimonas saemankumensis]